MGLRILTPRWAHVPCSGAGAGQSGGRANRPGIEALYLSMDPITAMAEYKQLSTLMPPGTLVTVKFDIGPVVDFSKGYEPSQWDPLWEDFDCDWRGLWFNQKVEPPSWVLGDMVIAAGAKGMQFASRKNQGGVNIVMYNQALNASDLVEVYDPKRALPKNADSWK